MKIVKATGLVPVEALEGSKFGTHKPGDVFGMEPTRAKKAEHDGYVKFVDIPEGVETEDTEEPDPELLLTDAPDWRSMHHLSKFAHAKKLGYDGENKSEAVNAWLEAQEA